MGSESGRFEAQTTGDSRAEGNEWSEDDMRDIALELEHQEDYESKDRVAKALELTLAGHGRDAQKMNETMKQHIADNGRRLEELAKRAEAEGFASMGKSARSSADAKGETLPSLHELADAVDEDDRRERQLKSEKIESKRERLREVYRRTRLGRTRLEQIEKTQGTELSISEMNERETIVAGKKQVIEDDQRRRRQAEEKIGKYEAGSSGMHESYNSGPKDDLHDNIDAERKQIIEDYERRQRELKEQRDHTVANLVRKREEIPQNEAESADDAQDKVDDAMRKRLVETGFTQAQIDAVMEKDQKNQQPTSRPPETAHRPASG